MEGERGEQGERGGRGMAGGSRRGEVRRESGRGLGW